MIKVKIVSPTKCYITGFDSPQEVLTLRDSLTYKNTSVGFNISKLNKNRWLKQNKPEIFQERMKELYDQYTACMLKQDGQGFFFYPGSIPSLKGIEVVENRIVYPNPKKIPWAKPLSVTLYPYQSESVERLLAAKHGCVEICTGGGKTNILLTLSRELGEGTVVVTPSASIFNEIYETFTHHLGKSNVGGYGDGKKQIGKKVTVCIAKSLTMLEPGTEAYEFFKKTKAVLFDESHQVPADNLESTCHGVFADTPYRMFFSGTQVRGDGKEKLLEAIIGNKVKVLTTKEGVEGGYICPVKVSVVETISPNSISYDDPLKTKREHFLYNKNIADLAAKIANDAWNEKQQSTLILVEELSQIAMLKSRLRVPFGYAHSGSKKDSEANGIEVVDPTESVEKFNKGEIKILIGTSCISTGTNMYPTHNTINWVGGSSEVKTKQGAIGRSVRILEKSKFKELHQPKPFSMIWDFKVIDIITLERHLKERVLMYEDATDDITFLKGL